MLQKAAASGYVDVAEIVRSLPRSLQVGDYFSGAGTMHKVMDSLMNAIRKRYPKESAGLKAVWRMAVWSVIC